MTRYLRLAAYAATFLVLMSHRDNDIADWPSLSTPCRGYYPMRSRRSIGE